GFSLVVNPGDDVRVNPPDGIAWEFTAQAIAIMNYVDTLYGETNFSATAAAYLQQIRLAQTSAPFTDGKGIPAATLNGENESVGGFSPLDQCLSTPFQCIPERVGLAASVWGLLADQKLNVFLENLPKSQVVTAAGPGGGPHIRVVRGEDGAEVRSFFAFDSSFSGGVRVASGDVDGDGISDIIAAAGPGGGPHVRVFSGFDGRELNSFFAYGSDFTGGVFVAAADLNGDGKAEVITGADAGGGPHVRVFDLANNTELFNFFAYGPMFSGGVRLATGDVTGDGTPDIVTGAGPGGGPHVRVFDGSTGQPVIGALGSFFAFDPVFSGGVFVSAADFTGDGRAEIVTGAGAGG
ncbi:MAG: VCBS repeat-containing protein, partial [Candidatus Omnitrophica bacterium]|nr:VCBS repeat-containing protein [Candidatus Omnitrophota bacterium]